MDPPGSPWLRSGFHYDKQNPPWFGAVETDSAACGLAGPESTSSGGSSEKQGEFSTAITQVPGHPLVDVISTFTVTFTLNYAFV